LYCQIGGTGRRPAGLVAPSRSGRGGDEVGAYWARAAHLEAASVHAFRTLAADLHAYGAPRRLVEAASRAAGDEVRHARACATLARRHGSSPVPVVVRSPPSRSLVEIAEENAVEGCVRETWGALVAA